MMNLGIRFPGKEIAGFSDALIREARKAATDEIRRGGTELRAELRADTSAANLGKLAMTWQRPRVYPEGRDHLSPAFVISSKAPLPMRAFSEGAVIRSGRGKWLAIPAPAIRGMRGYASVAAQPGGGLAGVGPRRARITPAGFAAATGLHLRMVYRGGREAFLVASGIGSARSRTGLRRRSKREVARGRAANAEFVAFFLVPQATIRKRLDVKGRLESAGVRVMGRLSASLERAAGAAARSAGG